MPAAAMRDLTSRALDPATALGATSADVRVVRPLEEAITIRAGRRDGVAGGESEGFPFLSQAPLTATYLAWAALWVAMVWGLAAASFVRKDL